MPEDPFELVPKLFAFADEAPEVQGFHVNVSFVSDHANREPNPIADAYDRSAAGEGLMKLVDGRLQGDVDMFFADQINEFFGGGFETRLDVTVGKFAEKWRIEIDREGRVFQRSRNLYAETISSRRELGAARYDTKFGAHMLTTWTVATWGGWWSPIDYVMLLTMSFDQVYDLGAHPRYDDGLYENW